MGMLIMGNYEGAYAQYTDKYDEYDDNDQSHGSVMATVGCGATMGNNGLDLGS